MRRLAILVPLVTLLVGCPSRGPNTAAGDAESVANAPGPTENPRAASADASTAPSSVATPSSDASTPPSEASTPSNAPAPAASAPTAASPDEPEPDPITHPCVVTSAQFDIAFRDGDRSCKRDADCECIPMRVGDRQGCGGVTSKRTGAKLRALAKSFEDMKCQATRKCAKRICTPRCVSGQCE